MTSRQRENIGIALAVMSMLFVLLIAARTELDESPNLVQPVNSQIVNTCAEDEDWVVTDYRNPMATEDAAGVSRWCQHVDAQNWVSSQ